MLVQEVVVDPILLCLPNPCNSLDQLEDFIGAIVGWRGFLDRADICVLLSYSTRVALNTDGEFPHRHRLKELINRFGCTIADANTISRVANLIMDRTPYLEEYYGIDAVLFDEDTFEFTPKVLLDRLSTNCRSAFRDDIVIAGMKEDDSCESHLMVASGVEIESQTPSVISVRADVHDIDFVSSDVDIAEELPISISKRIPIYFTHEQLIESLDLWAIWDGASSEEGVHLSVVACVKNLISSGAADDEICDFIIGERFIASLRAWGADARRDYAMVTVESCARIVLGIPKNPIKKFRISAKAKAQQRSREDGALAFRTHLTKKGVGLRLLYWKRTDGVIEFANIGSKDELEIL